MRLLVVEFMDCVEQLFVCLAAWKSYSCSRATGIKVNHWSTFWQHENVIFEVIIPK